MNDPAINQLKLSLRHKGLSLTTPRLAVFNQLKGSEPQSMRELYLELKGKLDRASLYRIINAFEKAGIVQRVYIGWKYKLELTDKFVDHHHHISCPTCGKISAIDASELIEQFIKQLADSQGATAITHQLEIQAYCADCKKDG